MTEIVIKSEENLDLTEEHLDLTPENGTVLNDEMEELNSGLNLQMEDLMDPYDFSQPLVADSDGNFSCTACDKKYRSKNHLKRHISIVHLNIKKYPCPTCGKRFHSSQPLRIHQRIHTGEKPCKCDECGKAFSDPSALRGHLRMHNRQLGIMCDICGRYMATDNSLRNHKKRHEINGHDKSMFRFQCPECSLIFCTEDDFEAHFADHRGARVYSCQECPRSYKNFQSYQYHKRTHTGEKPFQCKECGNHFRSANLVRLHSVVHKHPDERPKYHCDECGKDFSLIKTLNFHRCKGTYPCWVCKTMFTSLNELEDHKSTHTLEEMKRYLCKVCGRRFSKSSVLKTHRCKMLVVVEYDEPGKNAPKSEPQEYEQYEFHIDLCKFICREDYVDDEDHEEASIFIAGDMAREASGQSAEYEGFDGESDVLYIKDEIMEQDVSEDHSTIQTTSPSANDAAQDNGDIPPQCDFDDTPTSESSIKHGYVKDDDAMDDSESAALAVYTFDQAEMNPSCILDKMCQKCGGDIDKDVIVGGENGSYCASHICRRTKKKIAGTKKFMPLRKTLALKSSSPKRKVKGVMKKS